MFRFLSRGRRAPKKASWPPLVPAFEEGVEARPAPAPTGGS